MAEGSSQFNFGESVYFYQINRRQIAQYACAIGRNGGVAIAFGAMCTSLAQDIVVEPIGPFTVPPLPGVKDVNSKPTPAKVAKRCFAWGRST